MQKGVTIYTTPQQNLRQECAYLNRKTAPCACRVLRLYVYTVQPEVTMDYIRKP